MRAYRDNLAGEGLTFWRAFKVRLLISLIACTCYVATWQVVYYKFAPDFMEKYAGYTLERAQQSGPSAVELAEKTGEMAEFKEMYRNPLLLSRKRRFPAPAPA